MPTVGTLRTRISLDSAEFQQSMQGINRELRGLKAETRAVTSSGTGFARGTTEMKAKADVLNRTLEVQQTQVRELRQRYEESKRTTGENSRETQNANIAYQRAVADMNKTENALKGLTAEIERQTNPWNRLSENMDVAGKRIQDFGRGMTDFGRGMTTRVTLPLLGLGAGVLKVGMDFEAGMSQVQALTGGTAEEMARMSDQAKELGANTRFSATEAAEGMAFLGMAGWETSSILDGMPGLLSLAASANMELGRAADITSNIMAAFNIEAKEAGRVADVLAHASSNSNTNVEQLGEAMKYVAPTANTLGLSIEDTAAAIMSVSDAGIQGSQAGRAFGTSLLRLADPTKAMKDEMNKLKVSFFDSKGEMKGLPQIVNELEKAMADYDSEQRAASLSTIFGTEAQRHWAIMLDAGSDALGKNSKELENSEGAAQNMADTMQDNAKGAMIEFKSAVEGIGIELAEHMIPAVTDIIGKGTELVRKFGELDDETQQNIIKMGLFAAAIGPVAMVAGNLTTAIGGVVRVGGRLIGILGGTGGLIARLGMLGVSGPVGLAIAGVGALAGGIYLLSRDSEKLHDINWELVESMEAEVNATDDLIDRYEELEGKNRLTTDEILRYMDVLSELKSAKAEQTIKALTDEQAELLEKSGFTNEEMEEFLKLNGEIVEKAPETTQAISDEGNAFAENVETLKQLNHEKREELKITAQRELEKALENEVALLKEKETLVSDLRKIEEDISGYDKDRLEISREINTEKQKAKDLLLEVEEIERELEGLSGRDLAFARDKLFTKEEELKNQNWLVKELEDEKDKLDRLIDGAIEKRDVKNQDLETTLEELEKTETLQHNYEALILTQAGVTAEKGKGLEVVEEEIRELERTRKEIEKQTPEIQKNTEGYQQNVRELDTQLGRLRNAKSELENINDLAGKTIYDKNIKISTDPSIYSLNSMLSAPINKRINLQGHSFRAMMYADGTDHHPGGPFIAGEEGWELGRYGNRWEMLNFGMYDRPSGYEVFTHDQSKKIMRSLNAMPKYASGNNMGAETNRITNYIDDDFELVTLLKEQNQILVKLLQKENVAYVDLESVYQPIKGRLDQDNYSSYKRRR